MKMRVGIYGHHFSYLIRQAVIYSWNQRHILSMQANEGEGISSSVKHKVPRPRAAPAKRFKSPLASKSTGVRMMLSPRVISPSTTLARSSQESPISPFIKKRSMLGHGKFKPFRAMN